VPTCEHAGVLVTRNGLAPQARVAMQQPSLVLLVSCKYPASRDPRLETG
jgi:hypothetical protein